MDIRLIQNKKARKLDLKAKTKVEDILRKLNINPETVLVKRNDEFVPDIENETLKDKDKLEIIRIVSGG